MKAVDMKDILQYTFLSNLSYAPDGQRAAFVASKADEQENTYSRCLWLLEGSKTKQLTALGREGTYVWEDSDHLLFPAVRTAAEKKRAEAGEQFTVWYRLSLSGGEAMPAFTLPFACTGLVPLPEGRFAALGIIDKAIPDYYQMTDEARAKVAADIKAEADYEVFDEAPFWGNGEGITNGKRQALFLVDGDSITRITAPTENVGSPVVIGGKVYYTVTDFVDLLPECGLRIDELDPATGIRRTLCTGDSLCEPELTKMGDTLLVLASDGKRHGMNENKFVWQVDTSSGAIRLLRAEEYSMYSIVGSDCRLGGGRQMQDKDGKLYFLTTREGSSHLYRLDETGEAVPMLEKDGSIDMIAVSDHSDTVLMTAMYDMRLQELYALSLQSGKLTRLTHFNDDCLKGRYVACPEPVQVESEGLTIGGWVLKPKDFDPHKSYPAILDIHGGPKTVYGPVFMHEMQLWAGMGYFVLYCNPMGSDGRDSAFMDIRGHYGDTDYRNLMDFTDAVLAAYPQIDRARVCETGGSYGGFMTNWIIGHTDRFCCAASQRSISNWLSFHGTSDIGWCFAADQCGATPYTDYEKMWAQSPLKYAAHVKTPTLFIHSDEDYRCPLSEGLQMFTALKEHGVPARLCMFHGENHELSRSGKPKHRIRRLQEITAWFEKYAK
ncbi:MAG: S9 family peptidase [Clostridia bacterium]|nr:S9 family peptidase [Clostridia bacterium]